MTHQAERYKQLLGFGKVDFQSKQLQLAKLKRNYLIIKNPEQPQHQFLSTLSRHDKDWVGITGRAITDWIFVSPWMQEPATFNLFIWKYILTSPGTTNHLGTNVIFVSAAKTAIFHFPMVPECTKTLFGNKLAWTMITPIIIKPTLNTQ